MRTKCPRCSAVMATDPEGDLHCRVCGKTVVLPRPEKGEYRPRPTAASVATGMVVIRIQLMSRSRYNMPVICLMPDCEKEARNARVWCHRHSTMMRNEYGLETRWVDMSIHQTHGIIDLRCIVDGTYLYAQDINWYPVDGGPHPIRAEEISCQIRNPVKELCGKSLRYLAECMEIAGMDYWVDSGSRRNAGGNEKPIRNFRLRGEPDYYIVRRGRRFLDKRSLFYADEPIAKYTPEGKGKRYEAR